MKIYSPIAVIGDYFFESNRSDSVKVVVHDGTELPSLRYGNIRCSIVCILIKKKKIKKQQKTLPE